MRFVGAVGLILALGLGCSGGGETSPSPDGAPASKVEKRGKHKANQDERADPAPAAPGSLPRYALTLSLSPAAAAKLSASGETIHVAAGYYGFAANPKDGNEEGELSLGREELDVAGAGPVELGKVAISASELAKTKDGQAQVNVNVYTSRKKFPNNLLDCDAVEDAVSVVASKSPVPVACKLIGE